MATKTNQEKHLKWFEIRLQFRPRHMYNVCNLSCPVLSCLATVFSGFLFLVTSMCLLLSCSMSICLLWLLLHLSPPFCQDPHLSLVCCSAPSQLFLVSPCSFILPVVAWCFVCMFVVFVILGPVFCFLEFASFFTSFVLISSSFKTCPSLLWPQVSHM